jgi:hypothetical protein
MPTRASCVDLFSAYDGAAPATSDEPYGLSDPRALLAVTAILEGGSIRLQESQRVGFET